MLGVGNEWIEHTESENIDRFHPVPFLGRNAQALCKFLWSIAIVSITEICFWENSNVKRLQTVHSMQEKAGRSFCRAIIEHLKNTHNHKRYLPCL